MVHKTIVGSGIGDCYLEDELITCEIDNKKLRGAWSVSFDGCKVGWHSPKSPPGLVHGNLINFWASELQDIGCYLDESEKTIRCFPKRKLEGWLGSYPIR